MKIWRWVKTHRGLYRVSTDGQVKSVARQVPHCNNGTITTKSYPERILKPNPIRGGYLQVYLWKENKRRPVTIHRLVAEAFVPNPNDLPEVNHKDLDKTNNHWTNLEWCTGQGNKDHAKANEATLRGEESKNAKATWQIVNRIRRLSQKGWTRKRLALKFNLAKETIRQIVTHLTWKRPVTSRNR